MDTDNGLSLCETKDKCRKTKGRGGSRNYGITEIELRFATPDNKTTRQRDLGFARQRDN